MEKNKKKAKMKNPYIEGKRLNGGLTKKENEVLDELMDMPLNATLEPLKKAEKKVNRK